MMKTILLILVFGLSQALFAQDKYVKKFIKNHKSDKGATYLIAANGSDFELGNDKLEGVFSLIGKTKDVNILNINKTFQIEDSFNDLNDKLEGKYQTLMRTSTEGNQTILYFDEKNKYYYFLNMSEESINLFTLQIK